MGYYEYRHALGLLDPLLNMVSTEELEVIEELIKSRDEFAIYTNRSHSLEQGKSLLSEPVVPGDSLERRGLGWVMALARVELGAMVAGFTSHDKPFAALPPSRYETPQFENLLLDSARAHYAALRNDPVAKQYAAQRIRVGTTPTRMAARSSVSPREEQRAIAYGRRVAITREFVSAVKDLGSRQLTPQQTAELTAWEKQLVRLQSTILFKVLGLGEYIASGQSQHSTTMTFDQQRFRACPRLLTMAKQAMADGTGKIDRTYLGK